jgi:8-oxo-dGTP diphosphatase
LPSERSAPGPQSPHEAEPEKRLEVAAAVIFNEQGQFLLAQRPAGKAYAGYWEFPGGKIERDEVARAALARELHEELGIEVTTAYPWLTRDYDYEHAAVRLRFFRVLGWTGNLHGRESQHFSWQTVRQVTVTPVLPANGPILRALELPPVYGITHASALGPALQLERIERALGRGLRLIQVREPTMAADALADFSSKVVHLARRYGALVLVNAGVEIATQAGADGVHLTASKLMAATQRPVCNWCAASCHNAAELERARELALDFVVLGPVQATPTHPHAKPLAWDRFEELASGSTLPTYALGGLEPGDLQLSWHRGAHGIAMMRGAWPQV